MGARIVFVSDSHLGFDLPQRPRVERPRRGPDFFANLERALAPALRGEADAVVHGGDLLFRSRVKPDLARRAYEPLLAVAARGVPVLLVPGNHERSSLPCGLLARHPRMLVFDRPRTFVLDLAGIRVAFAGFPYEPEAGSRFAELLRATGWNAPEATVRFLCLHQLVEGASVGPSGHVFRPDADVVRGREIPEGFRAVLCGHVHRAQVLRRDLAGRPLAAPVLYAGSVERTSSAERDETKGFFMLEAGQGGAVSWRFEPLPARPMIDLEVQADADPRVIRESLARAPPRAVVRLRPPRGLLLPAWLTASGARELAPPGCIVELAPDRSALRSES